MTEESGRCIVCNSRSLDVVGGDLHCKHCDVTFAADRRPPDYGALYTRADSLYAAHFQNIDRFQTTDSLSALLLPFERRLLALLKARPTIRQLVDIGCGTGRFLRAAAASVAEAIGFEVATPLAQRLQQHGRTVYLGGLEEFLASAMRPHAVTLLEVVEHLPEPGQAIRRVFDEKSPAMLAVVVPLSAVRRRFDKRFAQHDVPPNHLTWWNEQSLSALLTHPGYTVRIERVAESRRSMLGHFYRNGMQPHHASVGQWLAGVVRPPTFWLLGIAEKS